VVVALAAVDITIVRTLNLIIIIIISGGGGGSSSSE
jgi:hypothetical protein